MPFQDYHSHGTGDNSSLHSSIYTDYDAESQINDIYPAKVPESSDEDEPQANGFTIHVNLQSNGSVTSNAIPTKKAPHPISPLAQSKPQQLKKFVPPDGGYGWVVVFASFLIQAITGSVGYIHGMMYPEFLRTFEAGVVTTSWVSSIQVAVWFTGSMIAGPLVQTIGSRKVCWIGAVIITTSLLISSQATHISMLFIFYGVFCGLGMSFIFFPAVIVIQQYFVKRRSIAVAIGNSGAPFGGFVMPPLVDFLIQTYGWRGAQMIMAGITAQVFIIAYFFKPLPLPPPAPTTKPQPKKKRTEKLEEMLHQSMSNLASITTLSNIKENTSKGKAFLKRFLDLSLLKNLNMTLDMLAYGLYSFGFIVPSMFLPLKARTIGIADPYPTILLSIIGISDVVGRFVSGFVGQCLGQKRLIHYMFAMLLGGTATAISCVSHIFPGLALYACIFGLSTGMTRAYSSIVLTDMMGLEHLPKAYAFKLFLNGLTVLASAPFAAWIMSYTNLDVSFLVIGCIQSLGGVTIFTLLILRKCGCAPVRKA